MMSSLLDDDDCEAMTPSRRAVLGAAGMLFAASFVPKFAYAAAGSRDPRFLLIILRGALDGLSAVPPIGDPDYQGLREGIALADGRLRGRAAAGRLLLPASRHAEPGAALCGAPGQHRACGGDRLSRALAFRRPGRAGKRAGRAGPDRERLAQPADRLPAARARACRGAACSASASCRRWWCGAARPSWAGRRRACRARGMT